MKEIICKEEIGGGLFMHTIYEPLQELIRCKDCKHYRINTVYPGTKMIMTYCAKTGIAESKPDWFCADGER